MSLRESVGTAGDAFASLTTRTADETVEQTRLLWPVVVGPGLEPPGLPAMEPPTRTLNDAGRRVCEADRSFIEFQAHGGRGRPAFLRVVRRTQGSALDRPFAPPDGHQLTLADAS